MQGEFIEGLVRYPSDLPCPQADTDLVPRERRYISDISDVRNMRMFQQEFQATRNRIVFIFTEEEQREFREWYKNEILYGGAWFLADWPTLHKDKDVPHRFVGHPKYEWLTGMNPGMMGRQIGRGGASQPVSICKVTATVELYDPRKVGKKSNVYTSKIYPLIFTDDVGGNYRLWAMPSYRFYDDMRGYYSIVSGNIKGGVKSLSFGPDDFASEGYTVVSGVIRQYTFSAYDMGSDELGGVYTIDSGILNSHLIVYDYWDDDDLGSDNYVIVSGELT